MTAGIANVLRGVAATLLIAGVIAAAVARVTPVSWFPWDILVALVLFGAGCALGLFVKRKSIHTQGAGNRAA
jgi:uncharacterized membrane protein